MFNPSRGGHSRVKSGSKGGRGRLGGGSARSMPPLQHPPASVVLDCLNRLALELETALGSRYQACAAHRAPTCACHLHRHAAGQLCPQGRGPGGRCAMLDAEELRRALVGVASEAGAAARVPPPQRAASLLPTPRHPACPRPVQTPAPAPACTARRCCPVATQIWTACWVAACPSAACC